MHIYWCTPFLIWYIKLCSTLICTLLICPIITCCSLSCPHTIALKLTIQTLDNFQAFYVNKYTDHHVFKISIQFLFHFSYFFSFWFFKYMEKRPNNHSKRCFEKKYAEMSLNEKKSRNTKNQCATLLMYNSQFSALWQICVLPICKYFCGTVFLMTCLRHQRLAVDLSILPDLKSFELKCWWHNIRFVCLPCFHIDYHSLTGPIKLRFFYLTKSA
jgi:hypothetical protein